MNEIVITIEPFQPPSVVAPPFAIGSTSFIGFLPGKKTVLKYPLKHRGNDFHLDDLWRLAVTAEAQIYDRLGHHPHVLRYDGQNEDGIILEYAANGTVREYLQNNPSTTTKQRVIWCRELAEAVVHIHSKHVLHCNICAGKALLDERLSLKLADFQGILKDPLTGSTVVDGNRGGASKWSLPREIDDGQSVKSDIFAFGTTIYEIMEGKEPFPELDSCMDEETIQARFVAAQFPDVHAIPVGEIMHKCWLQQYKAADELLADLVLLEGQY